MSPSDCTRLSSPTSLCPHSSESNVTLALDNVALIIFLAELAETNPAEIFVSGDFSEGSVSRGVRTNNDNMTSSTTGGSSSCDKSRKKKRFSDEQIRSLEDMFSSESKPDPGIKQQLAAELGLQPRHVAIWFQNRRARLKPKKIEREYDSLKASYDALACKFESLKKENLSLTAQVRTLMEKFERVRMDRSSMENAPEPTEQTCVQENKHKVGDQHGNKEHGFQMVEQPSHVGGGDNNIPLEMMYGSPFASSSATSWSSEYSCFLDQSSCGSSRWWEFW